MRCLMTCKPFLYMNDKNVCSILERTTDSERWQSSNITTMTFTIAKNGERFAVLCWNVIITCAKRASVTGLLRRATRLIILYRCGLTGLSGQTLTTLRRYAQAAITRSMNETAKINLRKSKQKRAMIYSTSIATLSYFKRTGWAGQRCEKAQKSPQMHTGRRFNMPPWGKNKKLKLPGSGA